MQRTDISSRQCLFIVILLALLLLYFLPTQTLNLVADVTVSQEEIDYFIQHDFQVTLQANMTTKQANVWVGFQDSVGELKSYLEDYQRLNLNLLVERLGYLNSTECLQEDPINELAALRLKIFEFRTKYVQSSSKEDFEVLAREYQNAIHEKNNLTLVKKEVEFRMNQFNTKESLLLQQKQKIGGFITQLSEKLNQAKHQLEDCKADIEKVKIEISQKSNEQHSQRAEYYAKDKQLVETLMRKLPKPPQGDIKVELQDSALQILANLTRSLAQEMNIDYIYPNDTSNSGYQELLDKRQAKESEKSRIENDIRILENEIQFAKEQQAQQQAQLAALIKEREDRREPVQQIDKELIRLTEMIEEYEKKLNLIKQPIDQYDEYNSQFDRDIQVFFRKYGSFDKECLERCLETKAILSQIQISKSHQRLEKIRSSAAQVRQKLLELQSGPDSNLH